MPHRKGLRRKIWTVFILQAAAISFAAVLGVYGASAVLKHVLIQTALQEEARHYWQRLHADPGADVPDTYNMTGYLVAAGGDNPRVPADIRGLPVGFHALPRAQGGSLVLVEEDRQGRRLYLLFKQEQVDSLAFWFGMAPLAIVLVVIYVIAWTTYRASKRAVSPVIWLASQVQRWDPKQPESAILKPENLPTDVEGETLVLAQSLHDFASRIESFVERERDFTRDASHELRTPLTVIRVAGDMMAADDKLSPMSRKALGRIQGAGRDMEALIEAFLILAREGDTGLPDDDFDVCDVVAEEVEKARMLLAGKPVQISCVRHGGFRLHAPARVLSVMVGNLLRNACHYTDEGRITVTVEPGQVSVADTGIGMDEAQLARVFEPFFRGGQHNKEGQGIGLSIVQRLSARYGWPVRLESRPGKGTTATISFPEYQSLD
ncbi:sensor histidine kinase [Arenimonas caeni]|jgi:signal transduction histidine kinase|uniref:histidine kinase n=1 Tax=Arenimonas caeni TaxID=2058085 RepID=A0A2P6MCX1_9GAMM|nr:HAMP domain-containing sensor histidine kinase [Arenimonas caeni]MDY0021232.1 HAMP domain-containing sensor histidine kinase [Arenimonas caeni]PRH83822.1 two-component sensor histidine kinase [Arenimonas caeni]